MDELLRFLDEMSALKTEARAVTLPDGTKETTAAHTWRMALLAMLVGSRLEHPVDIDRTVRIVIAHDVIEAYVGDVAAFDFEERERQKRVELDTLREKMREYSDERVREVFELWKEYEDRETPEAKTAKALDRIEVRLQGLQSPNISEWSDDHAAYFLFGGDKYCEHDAFLSELLEHTKARFREIIENETGKDLSALERLSEELRVKHG